jgi:dTDP-4-amino-4,6-dideoxygalactose transaminase
MIPAAKPAIGDVEREAVDRVMRSGMLAQGPEVAAFEAEFASAVVDGSYCVAVNSGTSALHLSLLAAGIGPGDEVIVPSFTFAATANAVALTGATPVFADIDPMYFCLDPEAAAGSITARTRAVMPVHLYGQPSELDSLIALCTRAGLVLLEDAAQAHASTLGGRPVGTWGLAGSFSFYPTKNMTSGEGGMVVTADADFARKIRLLRNQGQERRYENEVVGLNNRMTDIHAAIGRVQLGQLPGWTIRRRENARFFDENLRGVVTPAVRPGAVHVYHQYTIRVPGHNRDSFARALLERGVGTGVYYPVPSHRLPAFARELHLPQTDRAALECLSLPVYPSLTETELEVIVEAVNHVAQAGS